MINIGSLTEHTGLNKDQIENLSDKGFITEISRAALIKNNKDKSIAACKKFELGNETLAQHIDTVFIRPPSKTRSDCEGKLINFKVSVPMFYDPDLSSIKDLMNDLKFHPMDEYIIDNVFYDIDVYCDGKSYYLGFPADALERVQSEETLNWSPRKKNENGGTIIDGWDPYLLFKSYLKPRP